IRVHDQGTVNVALTATGSTVKLDPTGNTVSLSATDRAKLDTTNTHLGNIESQANKLNFDGSGNLETAPAPAAAATKNFFQDFSVDNDASEHNYDLGKTIKASLIVVAGVDDNVDIRFKNGNTIVLVLEGS